MEYLTTLVHRSTSITVRVGDDLCTLRTDEAGIAYQERDGMVDPQIDSAILLDFAAMPPVAGWMVGPWDPARGTPPEAQPLYRVDPTAVSREQIVADTEARMQVKDAALGQAQATIATLESELSSARAEIAALRKQPPANASPPAPMVEGTRLVAAEKPKAAPKGKGKDDEKEKGERAPVLAQPDDDALDGIKTV